MSEIVAYCGLDCSKCDAYIATQTYDFERKKRIAERWTKGLKVEFKPEDTNCLGCMSDKVSGWCTRICRIRPCAEVRKVKTCAHCGEYPCANLKEFQSSEPEATRNLEKIRRTLAVL
jgi:hypothetical protein